MKPLESYNYQSQKALDLFEAMKTTMQSVVHHQEGDVYLHTQMVIDQVEKNYPDDLCTTLDALTDVALLHDIAKPLTTTFEDGDWRSPGHAKLGEKVAREIIWEHMPFECREEICAFIRFHGLPIWFQEKENPEMALFRASLRCNLKVLAFFAECDFKGRICNDLEESLFKIECFREMAQNLQCYEQQYKFTSDWARLHYFKNGGYHGKEIFEPKGSWLTITSGLPGSGKTTWVNNNFNGKIIELDEIRKKHKIKPTDKNAQGFIAQEAKEELRESLRKKEDVVWNATNITLQQRTQLIDLALNYDAKIKIVYFDKGIRDILDINRKREDEKQIPSDKLIKMFNKLEIPTEDECHILEVIY